MEANGPLSDDRGGNVDLGILKSLFVACTRRLASNILLDVVMSLWLVVEVERRFARKEEPGQKSHVPVH